MIHQRATVPTVWLTDLAGVPEALPTAMKEALAEVGFLVGCGRRLGDFLPGLGSHMCREHGIPTNFAGPIEADVVRRLTAAGGAVPPSLLDDHKDGQALRRIDDLPLVIQHGLALTALRALEQETPSAASARSPGLGPTKPQSATRAAAKPSFAGEAHSPTTGPRR